MICMIPVLQCNVCMMVDGNDGTLLSHVDNIPKKVRHFIMRALLCY